MESPVKRLNRNLSLLYGSNRVEDVWRQIEAKISQFKELDINISKQRNSLTQRDVMLISYGDQVSEPDRPPLRTLRDFLAAHLDQCISDLHILPFYPYSSDDGFSVIDYQQVNPSLGTWEDIRKLGQDFRLMFDGVINHISRESEWFKEYQRGESEFDNFFIEIAPETDLSLVFRPRALPLLTPVETKNGIRFVWTTFSDDQIDLNYANPQVLLKILDVIFFYLVNKASFLRLDAIAFLWKIPGTNCLHLPQTHAVIKILRAILDMVAPDVLLITETNVPHLENISYFGSGNDEAQLVYNFALPPLVLHSFYGGNAQILSNWASSLELPSNQVTFFNFLASHDGIGITPARGILNQVEINLIVDRVQAHKGFISYRSVEDGTQVPYELNIGFFDALSDPESDEPIEIQIDRFVTAHAIMLSLLGVPGVYFHSLFGSRSWIEGVVRTGMKRSINRKKLNLEDIENSLKDPSSLRSKVLHRLKTLFKIRTACPAFNPFAPQKILDLNPSIFAILRGTTGKVQALCLHNVSDKDQSITLNLFALGKQKARDMLSGMIYDGDEVSFIIRPYQSIWLDLPKS